MNGRKENEVIIKLIQINDANELIIYKLAEASDEKINNLIKSIIKNPHQ